MDAGPSQSCVGSLDTEECLLASPPAGRLALPTGTDVGTGASADDPGAPWHTQEPTDQHTEQRIDYIHSDLVTHRIDCSVSENFFKFPPTVKKSYKYD